MSSPVASVISGVTCYTDVFLVFLFVHMYIISLLFYMACIDIYILQSEINIPYYYYNKMYI